MHRTTSHALDRLELVQLVFRALVPLDISLEYLLDRCEVMP